MIAAAGVVTAAAGATYAYLRPSKTGDAEESEEGEMVSAADAMPDDEKKSWRISAGRTDGPEGYVFGDLTRGVVVRLWGRDKTEEEKAAEEAGDEQYTHVQCLVRDAVRIFRARGYTGTINMTHTVAYFSETCSVRVDGPKDGLAPWESSTNADDPEAASIAMGEHGSSGRVFATLLARLERRANSWSAISGGEDLDPSLTSSAHVGFALPVVKLGWGVSVALTVTTSSLLRFAKRAATLKEESEMQRLALDVTHLSIERAVHDDSEPERLAADVTQRSVEQAVAMVS